MQAVLGDIADVMHTRMSQGKSVHIKGLGYFRYVLDTVGVANLDDFDFEKQVKAVRVEFIPEREKTASGTYTRALVDSDDLEWIELSPDTKDDDPAQGGGDDGQDENRRTRQTLWRAVQMLTQKLCCQTIHDCPKVVPLHYESEWQ